MLVGLPLGSRANLARLNRVAAPSFARLPQPTAHMIEGDQLFCARPRHQAMNRALDDDCHKTRDDAALELEFAFWAGQTPAMTENVQNAFLLLPSQAGRRLLSGLKIKQQKTRCAEAVKRPKKMYPKSNTGAGDFSSLRSNGLMALILSCTGSEQHASKLTPALCAQYQTAHHWANASGGGAGSPPTAPPDQFHRHSRRIKAGCEESARNLGCALQVKDYLSRQGGTREMANALRRDALGKAPSGVDRRRQRLSQQHGFTNHEVPIRIEEI